MPTLVFVALIFSIVIVTSREEEQIRLLEEKYGKVIQVTAIIRHGERAPLNSYPRDPFHDYHWPDGKGQLLKIGQRTLYKMGLWFKKRYKKLLATVKSHTNISAVSAKTNRAIMSGQCFLAAFYSPPKDETIAKNLIWQPVPIHANSPPFDCTLQRMRNCSTFMRYMDEYFKSQKAKKIYDDHRKTFRILEKYSGIKFPRDNLYSCRLRVSSLADPLNIQNSLNFTLPSWTKKIYPEPLNSLKIEFVRGELDKYKVRRLTAGPLLEPVAKNMVSKSRNESTATFHFYFGGDTHVVWTLNALKFFNNKWPPYGSALIFELREKQDDHFVTILYKNLTTSLPAELLPSPCKKRKICTLKTFSRFAESLKPKDLPSEC